MGCGPSACTGAHAAAAASAVRRAQELARDVGALGAGETLDMRAITSEWLRAPRRPACARAGRARGVADGGGRRH